MKILFTILLSLALFTDCIAQNQFKISPHGLINICKGSSIKVEALAGYVSYKWSTGETSKLLTITKEGKYICTATDSNNYTYKDSVIVHFYPQKQHTIYSTPNPVEVCKGEKVTLEATNGFKYYLWENGKTTRVIEIFPEKSHYFNLTLKDSNHCLYYDSVHIKINDCGGCNLISTSKTSICKSGDSIILEAKAGYASYLWSNSFTGRVLVVKSVGKYVVEVTDSNGKKCKDSIEIKSGTKALFLYTNPHPPIVCKNKIVVIEANSGFTSYWWNVGGSTNRIEYKAEITKKIVVVAIDSNGCKAEKFIEVKVVDTCKCSGIIGAWPKTVLCGTGDSIHLEAKSGFKTYKWWNNYGGRLQWVYQPGWYSIEVTDSNGNKCKDSIHISQSQMPELKIVTSPNPPHIFYGDKIILEANNGFKEYKWSNGKTGQKIELYPQNNTDLMLIAKTESGCEASKTVKIYVLSPMFQSISDDKEGKFIVYPNPISQHRFNIVQNTSNTYQIRLFELNGKEFYRATLNNKSVEISVPEFIHGPVIIELISETDSFRQLLFIQ